MNSRGKWAFPKYELNAFPPQKSRFFATVWSIKVSFIFGVFIISALKPPDSALYCVLSLKNPVFCSCSEQGGGDTLPPMGGNPTPTQG